MKHLYKILLILLITSLSIPIFISCKKGPEDPWFSFYSRKHRVCEKWKLITYQKSTQINDSIFNYMFDGHGKIYYEYAAGHLQYRSVGSMAISFAKDGKYTWALDVSNDTSNMTYTEQGYWYFVSKNKQNNKKDKEQLTLQPLTTDYFFRHKNVTKTDNYQGTGDLESATYNIVKLASDEMKLHCEYKNTNNNTTGEHLRIVKIDITFQKQD